MPAVSLPPVFVGGVGRSGTHPVGRLVAASGSYFQIRTEVRFHADRNGLADLAHGKVGMDEFLAAMHGYFWKRGEPDPQGLHKFTTGEQLEEALGEFQRQFPTDRYAASRQLISNLLDRPTLEHGRAGWVELSTASVAEAGFLCKVYPEALFINMVRDGRVVAAGAARKLLNMTDDPVQALKQWERTIGRTHASLEKVPAEQVLTIDFDEFVSGDREGQLARLADFVGIDDVSRMARYMDKHINTDRANTGRWRERISPADVRMVERRYRRTYRRLTKQGVDWLPPRG